MKKKVKVKEEVKMIIGIIIFAIAIISILNYGQARIEKIESGKMILVNQNQMK